jgi:ankyrin repeat protein
MGSAAVAAAGGAAGSTAPGAPALDLSSACASAIATPLFLAARCGDSFLPLVEDLLARGARPGAGHANGDGPLIAALSAGAWACASAIIAAGARLQRSATGTPPAVVAVQG